MAKIEEIADERPRPIQTISMLRQVKKVEVESPEIARIVLLQLLPTWLHLYVWPFAFIFYPLAIYIYTVRYDDWLHGEQANTFLLCLTLFSSHALSFLGTKWSGSFRQWSTCRKAPSLAATGHVRIIPHKDQGVGEILPLTRPPRIGTNPPSISFTYNRDKYLYDYSDNTFRRISYPIDAVPTPSLAHFQKYKGIPSAAEVTKLQATYGKNVFDIPIPSFKELFAEHAVAPFFVFQLFCVGLWCLDEYWYYSLFTLFMLIVFECTVVFQRQRTLQEFRTMSIKPYPIQVYRAGTWFEIQTDDLLPGDLVSVGRTKEDSGLPCDLLLIQGNCIVNEAMLSGESTPLLKESIELRPPHETVDVNGIDKNAMLYGGTKVLQADSTSASPQGSSMSTPDNGCLAVVLKTGFGTSQGQLVRTMIFSQERVTANNMEAFVFIGFLLIFAVAASYYVWTKGIENGRPRMKLLLDCVIIITAVVPPELPMELSLAVNQSLIALSKYAIFCTEPFRIPLAGRVDVCCFDKTGTITGEDLIVEGVAGFGSGLTPLHETDTETTLTLASAHALVLLEEAGGIVGDPMEKTTLEALGWTLTKGDQIRPAPPAAPKKPAPQLALPPPKKGAPVPPPAPVQKEEAPKPRNPLKAQLQIKRRFQFSSALKRMSTISNVQMPDAKRRVLVSVKGAPETIKDMLVTVPEDYEKTYKGYAQRGSRVLALAFKWIDSATNEQISKMERNTVESGLKFAGFLVFHCPLKPDAVATIKALNDASHRCIMITGDNPLTAVHVAKTVEIVDRDVLILDRKEDGEETDLVWRSPDDAKVIPVDYTQPIDSDILKNYDLCVTGAALKHFATQPAWQDLVQHVWVYARVSPSQKEFILSTLKDLGYVTLMAGDGTNDVGALKKAHIGVALLNGSEEDLKQIAELQKIERLKKVYEQQLKLTSRFNGPPPAVPAAIAHLYPEVVEAQRKAAEDHQASRNARGAPPKFDMNSIMDKFQALEEEEEAPTIKLGDASVAAPFTSKLSNVGAIVNIIRQGRCTLVATVQMYKILALNCLISAYALSVQYLDGIKFGDYQVTVSGMLMSVCFFCISRAKPIEKLSKQRPIGNILNLYIFSTVLLQFLIHVGALVYMTELAKATDKLMLLEEDLVVDVSERKFRPGLLNSSVYILSLTQQVNTVAINFIGRPFREGITENPALYYGLLGVMAIAINGATDFMPEINSWLQLSPMSFSARFLFFCDMHKTDSGLQFRAHLVAVMFLDYFGAWVCEMTMKKLFANKPVRELITRGSERRDQRRIKEVLEAAEATAASEAKKTQ